MTGTHRCKGNYAQYVKLIMYRSCASPVSCLREDGSHDDYYSLKKHYRGQIRA